MDPDPLGKLYKDQNFYGMMETKETMGPGISRWVAEFQRRSSDSDFLKSFNLSAADSKLSKTLLLSILQSQINNASITETTLQVLEEIEAIDPNDAVPVLDSMRTAYCAVAVECTVKFLSATSDGIASDEYTSAVMRIWGGRVVELERRGSKLFSGEITRWRDDIEAAFFDAEVFERLAKLNTRYNAFSAVRDYLQKEMGPCFLEGKEQLKKRAVGSVDGTLEPARKEKACQKGNPQLQRKLPAFLRCDSGVKVSSAEELGRENSGSKNATELSAEVEIAQESLKSSFSEPCVKDPLPEKYKGGDVDVSSSNTCRDIVLFQTKDVDHKKKSFVQRANLIEENNPAHESPNLMEQNSTAHSYERDDSKDNFSTGVQLRRKKRKWSPLEEDTLRTGVKEFGVGHWATIQSSYNNIFENRTSVDLKDKWRNMTR